MAAKYDGKAGKAIIRAAVEAEWQGIARKSPVTVYTVPH